MARVCIICAREVTGGHPVQDDFVIRGIRSLKQRLNMAKNNVLVVEEGCMEEYRKRRAKYERDVAVRTVFAAIILLVFVLLPIFTTGFSLWASLLGVLLAGMFMALSLFSHFPKLVEGAVPAQAAGRSAGKAAGKRRK